MRNSCGGSDTSFEKKCGIRCQSDKDKMAFVDAHSRSRSTNDFIRKVIRCYMIYSKRRSQSSYAAILEKPILLKEAIRRFQSLGWLFMYNLQKKSIEMWYFVAIFSDNYEEGEDFRPN